MSGLPFAQPFVPVHQLDIPNLRGWVPPLPVNYDSKEVSLGYPSSIPPRILANHFQKTSLNPSIFTPSFFSPWIGQRSPMGYGQCGPNQASLPFLRSAKQWRNRSMAVFLCMLVWQLLAMGREFHWVGD